MTHASTSTSTRGGGESESDSSGDSSSGDSSSGDSSSSSNDGALALLAETRRAMEDFDDALVLRHEEGEGEGGGGGGSRGPGPGERSRGAARFHSSAAAASASTSMERSSIPAPAHDVPRSQSQQQAQQPQQPQEPQQQQQQRTRKFDGHRIRNLSSRIRGRMNQEQQQQQQQQRPQNQYYQNQNQDGIAGSSSSSRPLRRASLDKACTGTGAGATMSSDHDDDANTSEEAAAGGGRRRASDLAPTRDRRECRHAPTSPPETPPARLPPSSASLHSELQPHHNNNNESSSSSVSAPPPSRSLSRDELRALGRKAGAAVAGGSLIALGIPLLPMPGPVGEAMSIGGMAVLAKEFPAAQKVLDVGRDKLVEVLDKTAPSPAEEEEEEEEGEEHGDEGHEGRGLDHPRVAAPHGGTAHSEDGGGVIGAASSLSRRCASDSVRHNQTPLRPPPPPPEGDYFHLHDELLASQAARHPHRHNYHQGHYGHHGHRSHRRQGSWRNRNKKKNKKKKGPSKLKRSLHRSIHGMGTKVVLPLMDTVCTEREGAASFTSNGDGVGASTRKAFAGARSRLRSTFQSLSNEVAAGWREVEEEYAQQAQAQAEAAKMANMRRIQEQLEQQKRMQMAQEQQRRRQPLQAASCGGAATGNRSVFQQFLDASNGDASAMERRGSYASASSSGQYEEDYAEEDDEWETESCPERWIDVDESLWETMSL